MSKLATRRAELKPKQHGTRGSCVHLPRGPTFVCSVTNVALLAETPRDSVCNARGSVSSRRFRTVGDVLLQRSFKTDARLSKLTALEGVVVRTRRDCLQRAGRPFSCSH